MHYQRRNLLIVGAIGVTFIVWERQYFFAEPPRPNRLPPGRVRNPLPPEGVDVRRPPGAPEWLPLAPAPPPPPTHREANGRAGKYS
jgi:hypothetical protein